MSTHFGYMRWPVLNSEVESLPFKYLGLLIGDNPSKLPFWNLVVDWTREGFSF